VLWIFRADGGVEEIMTPEETEKYKSRCWEIESMFCWDYSNPELEKMMLQPYWK
jgi:hypothetical protein